MTRVPTRVSFVIPTRDAARTLGSCLASVRAQDHDDCEIVVVDNGSTDATAAIARLYTDNVIGLGPERSAQRNAGARIATGAVLVFGDADMRFEPAVARHVLEHLGPTGDEAVGAVVIPELAFGSGFWARCRVLEKQLYLGDPAVEAARGFRARDFLAVGGYDESFTGGEDWDLPDRVLALGGVLARTSSRVWHDEGRIALRSTFQKKRYYGRGLATYLSMPNRRGLSRSVLRKPALLARRPGVTTGLALLKAVEVSGAAIGLLEARTSPGPR